MDMLDARGREPCASNHGISNSGNRWHHEIVDVRPRHFGGPQTKLQIQPDRLKPSGSQLTRNGFADEVAAMRKAGEEHKPAPFQTNDALMAAMGDRLLDETAIYGDIETVAAGIEERRQLGVDLPIIGMPQGDNRTLEHVLGTLVS